jgi:hypothetical protein
MASVLFASSFLAGSLLTILVPICLLIALAIWYTRTIRNVPDNPIETAPHAAGAGDIDGRADAPEPAPPPSGS